VLLSKKNDFPRIPREARNTRYDYARSWDFFSYGRKQKKGPLLGASLAILNHVKRISLRRPADQAAFEFKSRANLEFPCAWGLARGAVCRWIEVDIVLAT